VDGEKRAYPATRMAGIGYIHNTQRYSEAGSGYSYGYVKITRGYSYGEVKIHLSNILMF
jgi:hypothetical protein